MVNYLLFHAFTQKTLPISNILKIFSLDVNDQISQKMVLKSKCS